MTTLITHIRSIRSEFVAAQKGKGFKAIGSALKTIFSPKVKKEMSPVPRRFRPYHTAYAKDREVKAAHEEFETILELIDFFQDNTNTWTDIAFRTMLNRLPMKIQTDFHSHMIKVQGYTDTHPPKLNAKHVQFFEKLIEGFVPFISYKIRYGKQKTNSEIDATLKEIRELFCLHKENSPLVLVKLSLLRGKFSGELERRLTVALETASQDKIDDFITYLHEQIFRDDHIPSKNRQLSFNVANEEKSYANDTIQGIRRVLLELAKRNAEVLRSGDTKVIQKEAFIPLDEIKRFVAYRDAYGHGRDIETVINEYFAVLEILDLAEKDHPALYGKLHQFKANCPTALQAKLAEALSYSSKEKIEKFIEELELIEKHAKDFPIYKKYFCKSKSEDDALSEYVELVSTIGNWKKLGDTEMEINSTEHPFMAALFNYSATNRTPEFPPDVDFVKNPELLLKPFTFTFSDAVEFFENPERWEHYI